MEWKESIKELPKVEGNKRARCLGACYVDKETKSWKGYVDVFFHPRIGWMRCETEEQVCVLKWIYISEIEEKND